MGNNFNKNYIKEIISKYDDILSNKNIINEDFNLVKLSSTSYSNLKYDKDGTQNDSVNKPLLDDINSAAKSVGVVATITTAKTGHNRTVKGSKSISRHMNGTGVDVAILEVNLITLIYDRNLIWHSQKTNYLKTSMNK